MWITSYKCEETSEDTNWSFSEVKLGHVNLVVGVTGSGKSRFLNTIFNLGKFVIRDEFKRGYWNIELHIDDVKYFWELRSVENPKTERSVIFESLVSIKNSEDPVELISRNEDNFLFKGVSLPKLSRNSSAVYLLRDEIEISPLYKGMRKLLKRDFFGVELNENCTYTSVPANILDKLDKDKNIEHIFYSGLGISTNLFLLKKYFPEIYDNVINQYKSVFPYIEQCDVSDFSTIYRDSSSSRNTPVLTIKEKGVSKKLGLQELSSGMQKVLLLILDLYTLPNGGIYLIDEYENSLGVNAINFFPTFLNEVGSGNQFIITSHHPYLINHIPVSEWLLFHRDGSHVNIKYGSELEERFGKSKHQAFTKLINDSFFLEGKE